MAIIGENLDLSLSNQIKVRQEKLGAPTLSTEDLAVFNSNTSWLRVVSSVDITSAEAAKLSDLYNGNILGNTLAKAFVLTGPSTYVDPNNLLAEPTLQSTLGSIYEGNSLEIEARTTYGIGSTKYGPSPPPGVESLTIKALNRGAIRKAQIKLKAYNPDQFRIIEALYCRLGFTILAEWGHSIYHQNNGNVRQDMYFTNTAYTNFLHRKKDFNGIVEDLENERKNCDHNYDGFIGYISNFNWNFNADGSYSITLDVINRGGLIDSLTASPDSINTAVSSSGGNAAEIAMDIGSYAKKFYTGLKDKPGLDSYYKEGESVGGFSFIVDGEVDEFSMNTNTQHYKTSAAEKEKNFYYISLGCLLRLIETKCFPKDKNGAPVIKIDYGYSSTFMLSHPFQQSINPEICRLANSLPSTPVYKDTKIDERSRMLEMLGQPVTTRVINYVAERKNTPIWSNSTPHPNLFREYIKEPGEQSNPFKADMMGIMLNLNFVVGTLKNNIDDNGEFNFYKTLSSILTEVNQCTGNLNSFNISYSEETNTIKIYDDTAIPNLETSINTTPLQVFGITPSNNLANDSLPKKDGSFVTSLNFSSKIFPNLQNAVAIAAQNPDTPAGEQISSFQRLNQGLKDGIAEGENITIPQLTPPWSKHLFNILILNGYFVSTYGEPRQYFGSEVIEEIDIKTAYQTLIQYDMSWRIGEGSISSPFFIPVDLNLEMHGISGFKLYNKFDITPDYILPPQYPKNVHFIVQGIEHTIQNNNWTTKIQTLSWPASENSPFQYNGEVIMGDPAFVSPETNPVPTPTPSPTNPTTENPTQDVPQEEPVESIFEDPSKEPYIEIRSSTSRDNFGIAYNTRVSPAEAVALLHPQARAKQQAFLNNMLANPKLKGALIRISSTYRTFNQQKDLFDSGLTKAKPGRSPHNFGAAFDINILDQTTKKVIATNKIPAPKQSSKELWVMLGIVENATAAGVTSWGGYPNFSYHDPVHFGLKINKAATTKALNEYAQSIGKNDAFDLTIEEAYTVDLVLA